MSPVAHTIDATQANFESDVLKASLQAPVLVDFWAEWCGPCKVLGPLLEKLAAEYNGAFILAKVDTDNEQALVGMFGVRSLPTVIIIKDGQIADGFAGALPEGEIRAFLAKFVRGPAIVGSDAQDVELEAQPAATEAPEQAVARLRQKIAAAPDNGELKLELATALMRAGDANAAASALDSLPARLADDQRAVRLRGLLELAAEIKDQPAIAELRARMEHDPGDLAACDLLGVRLLLDGQDEAALQAFLAVLEADRTWADGRARQRLLTAFQVIENAQLVGAFRRKMASLLF